MTCIEVFGSEYRLNPDALAKSGTIYGAVEFFPADEGNCIDITGLFDINVTVPDYYKGRVVDNFIENGAKRFLEFIQSDSYDFTDVQTFDLYVFAIIANYLDSKNAVEQVSKIIAERMNYDFTHLPREEYYHKWEVGNDNDPVTYTKLAPRYFTLIDDLNKMKTDEAYENIVNTYYNGKIHPDDAITNSDSKFAMLIDRDNQLKNDANEIKESKILKIISQIAYQWLLDMSAKENVVIDME